MMVPVRLASTQIMKPRLIVATAAIAVLSATVLTTTAAQAQTEPGRRGQRQSTSASSHQGFLFINGSYLPGPYEINCDGRILRINEAEFGEADFDLSQFQQESEALSELPIESLAAALDSLKLGQVIALSSARPPLFLSGTHAGHHLLTALLTPGSAAGEIPAYIAAEADRESWRMLVSGFRATPEFIDRATSCVTANNTVGVVDEDRSTALVWQNRIGFPLTLLAMFVVVLAFGHLLSNGPKQPVDRQDPRALADARRTIIQSLILIGLLSAVDLLWTLLAAQTGSMRELNPLGRGLIGNPLQLLLFKSTLTAASIGLLYWLHQQPLARLASWWCCLVLTLLTARVG